MGDNPSTAMSQSWIADRLNLRNAANVSQPMRRFEKELDRQSDSRIKGWIKIAKNCGSPLVCVGTRR